MPIPAIAAPIYVVDRIEGKFVIAATGAVVRPNPDVGVMNRAIRNPKSGQNFDDGGVVGNGRAVAIYSVARDIDIGHGQISHDQVVGVGPAYAGRVLLVGQVVAVGGILNDAIGAAVDGDVIVLPNVDRPVDRPGWRSQVGIGFEQNSDGT